MRRTVKQSAVAIVAACTVAAGVLALPTATAATPPPPRTGSLGQLVGTEGCVQDVNGAASEGCGPAAALKGAGTTVMSPDGTRVFVAGSTAGGSIAVFSRDAVTGVLTQTSCATATTFSTCTVIGELAGLLSITVNSDGTQLWAAMPEAAKVIRLDVDASGGLSRTAGPSGCAQDSSTPTSTCSPGSGIPKPDAVALSADGSTLYVASYTTTASSPATGSVAAFDLNTGSPIFRSCLQSGTAVQQCQSADGLDNALSLVVLGSNVYVGANGSGLLGSVASLSDNGGPGPLGLSEDACFGASPCTAARGVATVGDVTVSPDGKSVYAASQHLSAPSGADPGGKLDGGAVAVFSRASGGALTPIGCVVEPAALDSTCVAARGLIGANSLVVSPDNTDVYVASVRTDPAAPGTTPGSSAIAVLDRSLTPDPDATTHTFGQLTQAADATGCVAATSTDGCAVGRGLLEPGLRPHSLALSPTGSFLYTSAALSQAVAAFGRQGSDLRLSATPAPGPYAVGTRYDLTLTVLNAGALPATNVMLTDVMSSGAAIVGAAASQGTCNGSPTACSLGSIPVDGTVTVTISFQPTSSGTATNTARVGADQGDAAPADNIATTSLSSGPSTLTVLSGSGQTAKIGTAFAAPIKVALKDASGKGLAGAAVTFSAPATGASATFAGSRTQTVNTDATGVATSATPTANSTTGTYNVTVSAATATSKAVPLTNSLTGPSPSATPTASVSPGSGRLTLSLTSPATITPGTASNWRGSGQAGRPVTLRCYSRTPENSQPGMPTPKYFSARDAALGSNGVVTFTLSPGTNTRCFMRYRELQDTDATTSSSVAQQVATALSLSAYRDGVRRYHFQGTNLPRRPGQLITLYRYATGPNLDKSCVPGQELYTPSVGGSCVAVRTATAYTGSTSVWRIDRVFSGSGQFYFVARTSSTLTNVAGFSNQRLTIIH